MFRVAACVFDTGVLIEQLLRLCHVLRDRRFGAAVPVVERRGARFLRQEVQEVELAADAQEVHVQAREELDADVAVNVIAGDQQVVNPFEQRVVDHPGGLGLFADESLHHRCAVKMTEDRQRSTLIGVAAVPDHVQRRFAAVGIRGYFTRGLCRRVLFFDRRVVIPMQQPETAAPFFRGELQIRQLRGEKLSIVRGGLEIGIDEPDPEVILDDVQRDLAATDRPLDEPHDRVLRFVQHELIAALHRHRAIRHERIRGMGRLVVRQRVNVIVGLEKQCLPSLHALRVERIRHVRLRNQRVGIALQAIVRPSHAGIVIRTPRGDEFDRLSRRRRRPNEMEMFVGA